MITGIGTDICENDRIQKLYNKYGHHFLSRIYLEEEIEYCCRKKNPIPHLTARFALKEAFIKALGLKRDLSLSYKEVGLIGNFGKKKIIINGKLQSIIKKKHVNNIQFSISHAKKYSSAFIILEIN